MGHQQQQTRQRQARAVAWTQSSSGIIRSGNSTTPQSRDVAVPRLARAVAPGAAHNAASSYRARQDPAGAGWRVQTIRGARWGLSRLRMCAAGGVARLGVRRRGAAQRGRVIKAAAPRRVRAWVFAGPLIVLVNTRLRRDRSGPSIPDLSRHLLRPCFTEASCLTPDSRRSWLDIVSSTRRR